MTEQTFVHDLRRGLGRAILALQALPPVQREAYRAALLRCCLRDITIDVQVEGTKGFYLYTAACAFGDANFFVAEVAAAFATRLPFWRFLQLADFLTAAAKDGNQPALAALQSKYAALKAQLAAQRRFPLTYCEREQFEHLAGTLAYFEGWPAFRQTLADMAELLCAGQARGAEYPVFFDDFLSESEQAFGKKRVQTFLQKQSAKSPAVKALVQDFTAQQATREEWWQSPPPPAPTPAQLATQAKTAATDEFSLAKMNLVALRFARSATPEQLAALATMALSEPDARVQACLLRAFTQVDFPLDIDPLLPLALSEEDLLRRAAIAALYRFKDPRVRLLALQLLANGNTEASLRLLEKNWRKADDEAIRAAVLRTRRVSHDTQRYLEKLYRTHRSRGCAAALRHAYKNGPCAFCRYFVVEATIKNGLADEAFLNECRYDSYENTRVLAARRLKNL